RLQRGVNHKRFGDVEMAREYWAIGFSGGVAHRQRRHARMPEKNRRLVMFQPVGEESGTEVERDAHPLGNRAIDVALHRNRAALSRQARDRQVRPLQNFRQFGPALNRECLEALFFYEVTHREIAARLHREVAFFNIEQWQAHLLDFTDVIDDPLLFKSFGTIHELKKRKSMKLNAERLPQ